MSRLRILLDTGVLFSAILKPDSPPASAFRLALENGVLLTSDGLLAECEDVFERPYLANRVPRSERQRIIRILVNAGEKTVVASTIVECRDPKDDFLLALALDGRADYLVTGDADLLALDPWRGVRIVTPADFLAAVRA